MAKSIDPVREGYREEMRRRWKGDEKMVDYCDKSADEIAVLPDGSYFVTEKPRIKTSFCFGYDTDYSGHEANDAENARQAFLSAKENFINANIDMINREIDMLTRCGKEYDWQCAELVIYKYENSKISTWQVLRPNNVAGEKYFIDGTMPNNCHLMSDEEKEIVLGALKKTKEKFLKRLETYYKKYGTSKLKTWTYWRD